MRTALAFVVATWLLTLAVPAGAAQPAIKPVTKVAADHPILGAWTFTLSDESCTETYYFRPDGTSQVTSGEEVAESTFDVDATPSAKGFFQIRDTVIKDNGRKDCGGNVTPVGAEAVNFIRFSPSGEQMIMCKSETMEVCFGPLRRAREQET